MLCKSSSLALCFMIVVLTTVSAPGATAYRYLLDQTKLQQCQAGYSGIADPSTAKSRVPSCTGDKVDIEKCCGEVKGLLSSGSGPKDCLCDKDVWNYVQGQVLGAGIPNLTSDTLIAFTKACNIPNAGAGTCSAASG